MTTKSKITLLPVSLIFGLSVSTFRENAGSSSETLGDPLLDRAIILYAKSEDNFGGEGERHRKAYDYLKCALSLSDEYTEGGGG